jgi:hypothetical protein
MDPEFDLAQKIAITAIKTTAWQNDITEEDPDMTVHIPQLLRINTLGMITYNSQAGNTNLQMQERAYCIGFVQKNIATNFIEWMWLNTDKYVAKMDFNTGFGITGLGRIGVTVFGNEWKTFVDLSGYPEMRHCNYGRWIYSAEQEYSPSIIEAQNAIGPYLKCPVPESAICVLCVDMQKGRLANTALGLFTEIENCLLALNKS